MNDEQAPRPDQPPAAPSEPPPATPAPPPSDPGAPPPGTPGTGRFAMAPGSSAFKSAVLKTAQMIALTEEKVAEQWAKAKGGALMFSGGFSWKKGSGDGSGEVVRRWTAPMQAVKPRWRRRPWLTLGLALLLVGGLAGVGVWLARRPEQKPAAQPEPLF